MALSFIYLDSQITTNEGKNIFFAMECRHPLVSTLSNNSSARYFPFFVMPTFSSMFASDE